MIIFTNLKIYKKLKKIVKKNEKKEAFYLYLGFNGRDDLERSTRPYFH